MSILALLLVLIAAVCHAAWNLLAKRAGGGVAFTWLFVALAALIYAPIAGWIIVATRPEISPLGWVFIGGTGVLHIAYFLVLQRGYAAGDLSLVYPLARGTGPTLATVAAVAFLHQPLGPIAGIGVALIATSAFALSGGGPRTGNRSAAAYGLATGVVIAAYTLWDQHAVSVLLIPPLLYDWSGNVVRAILLTPAAWRERHVIAGYWRTLRLEAIGIAVLSPLAYILVLTAMTFTPVTYVAPARELSILFGTLLGARLLAEGDARRRIAAAIAMVVGVAALAVD